MLAEMIWDTEILGGVWNTANAVKKVALLIMPLFMLIESGSAIIRYLTGKEGNFFPDFTKFYSYILLWVCLVFYTPIMRTFNISIDAIVSYADGINPVEIMREGEDGKGGIALALFNSKYAALEGGVGKQMEVIKNDQQVNPGNSGGLDPIVNYWDQLKSASGIWVSYFTEFIADGATWIVRLIIERLSYLLVSILIIIGPLAVAFNAAPFFGPGTLVKWFTAWLGIKCWLITMSCLDLMIELVTAANQVKFITGKGVVEDYFLVLAVNYSLVIAYLMVPWITNKYINSDGGGMMGTAMRGGQTLANAGRAIATKGASLMK